MWAPSFSVAKDRHVAGPPKSCCFTKPEGSGPPDLGQRRILGLRMRREGLVSPMKALASALLSINYRAEAGTLVPWLEILPFN